MAAYKDSDLFRFAANQICKGYASCCCDAVWNAAAYLCPKDVLGTRSRLRDQIAELFKPTYRKVPGSYWWPDFSTKSQQERALALLFAAEIAEDAEKNRRESE